MMDAAQKWMKTFSNEELKEGYEALWLAKRMRNNVFLLGPVEMRSRRECARRKYVPRISAPRGGLRP